MEFLSIPFVVLMCITFVLYYATRRRRLQHALLLLAGATFAGYHHIAYLLIAVLITAFTFWMGKRIHAAVNTPLATIRLWLGIGGLVGFWLAARYWAPLFPLGISFYTFQAIAYLADIYWEEDPEDNFIDFSVYMLLFMKFLSGPIERAENLLPQLKKAHTFDYRQVTTGLKVVAWGCFLKLVIADRIGPALDLVLNNVRGASGMQLLVATLLYPIQLYADFAGYTCMALGLGRMLGFRLHPNFNRPFAATSTGELWRRWHMSLSFWVRDYVFMPLNTSLRGLKRWGTYAALLVTFVAIGVWHGAGWTFAIYGLFQGLVIIGAPAMGPRRERIYQLAGQATGQALMMIRTYLLFALSLLFFRLTSIADVVYTYAHLADGLQTTVKELRLGLSDHEWIIFGIATILMLTLEWLQSRYKIGERLEQLAAPLRWTVYMAIVGILFWFGSFGVENFIYIQF